MSSFAFDWNNVVATTSTILSGYRGLCMTLPDAFLILRATLSSETHHRSEHLVVKGLHKYISEHTMNIIYVGKE